MIFCALPSIFVYENDGIRQLTSHEAAIKRIATTTTTTTASKYAFVPQLRFHKQSDHYFYHRLHFILICKPKCHFQYLDHFHRCRRNNYANSTRSNNFRWNSSNACVRLSARRSLAKMIYNNYMRGRLWVLPKRDAIDSQPFIWHWTTKSIYVVCTLHALGWRVGGCVCARMFV